jgi:hypothetical protein
MRLCAVMRSRDDAAAEMRFCAMMRLGALNATRVG